MQHEDVVWGDRLDYRGKPVRVIKVGVLMIRVKLEDGTKIWVYAACLSLPVKV
jgi:hypothetical protein